MAYLGNDLQVAFPVYRNIDDISGSFNSSTTSFPLRVSGVAPVPAPLYSQQCLISVGGVVQRPDDTGSEGFRLSGGNIIFASAPTTGADFFGVILAGADYINAGGNFPSGTAAVPSITFNDDLDTGIYNSGINQVSIATGGSERLRIDSAGQIESVSLGTAAAPAFSFTTDPNTGIYSPGADQVAISTGGSGRLFVDASGRVGVNTANPLQQFHVNGNAVVGGSPAARYSSFTVAGDSAIQAGAPLLNFVNAAGSTRFGYVYHNGTGGNFDILNQENGGLTLGTNNQERLRITSAGLVGVGTSAPGYLLSAVTSDTSATTYVGQLFSQANPSGTSVSYLRLEKGGGFGGAIGGYIEQGVGSGLKLSTLNSGTLSEAVTITNTGRVGIGTTSPANTLHVVGTAQINTGDSADGLLIRRQFNNPIDLRLRTFDDSAKDYIFRNDNGTLRFIRNATEVAQLDSSGRLLVGTSTSIPTFGVSPQFEVAGGEAYQANLAYRADAFAPYISIGHSRSASVGTHTILQNGDDFGTLGFVGSDGSSFVRGATISAQVDGTPGTNSMPGRIVLSTTAAGASSPTERMRIRQDGNILFGKTSLDFSVAGIQTEASSTSLTITRTSGDALTLRRNTDNGDIVSFYRDGTKVGSISVTTSATAYNTSSDYRLKENVTAVTDGITRLQQLKPSRFNFIADPVKTVDGFIAHEVQAVVPEAITGEKDAVDDDGNPVYQGIDQSKMVPLVVAALQECIKKVEALELELALLKSKP